MVKRLISQIGILVIALMFSVSGISLIPCSAAAKDPYIGNWSVTKVVLSAPGATLSKQKQKNLIGKKLSLTETKATFGTDTLKAPSYQVSEITSDDFSGSWGVTAKKVGLGSSILMVEVYTGQGMSADLWKPLGTIFVKNTKSLLMYLDGVYFELAKK
jgi:hypothetical protein